MRGELAWREPGPARVGAVGAGPGPMTPAAVRMSPWTSPATSTAPRSGVAPGAVLRCLTAPGAGGGRRQGVRRISGNHRQTQRCARSSSRWAPPRGARPAPCSGEPARRATGGRGGENYSDEAADESARGATTRLMRLDAARGTTQTNPRSGTRRPPRTCTNPAGTRRTGARRARLTPCELSSHHVSSARTMRAQLDKIHLSSIRASSPRTMRAEVTSPNRLPQGGGRDRG